MAELEEEIKKAKNKLFTWFVWLLIVGLVIGVVGIIIYATSNY